MWGLAVLVLLVGGCGSASADEETSAEPLPTATVTQRPPAVDGGSTGGGSVSGGSGGGGGSVYYRNCDAAKAAGAAPVRTGDPGYGRHLDGDGVGCEW